MLTVAYDGTNYCGWQIQPTGITIEEVLNRELSRLLKEDVRVLGVSRTDSGVHARGNLCVFDTETKIPPEKLCLAINQSLPEDIVVQASCQVPRWFHPRKWDSIKTYEYVIWNAKIPDPLTRRYSYFFFIPLDAEKMKRGAAYLKGEHDFKSFCSAHSDKDYTVRTITDISVRQEGQKIIIRVSATGFLYNMVRIIVGTLLRVGTGFWTPEHVEEILEAKDRRLAGPKAPAEGLTLQEIRLMDFDKVLAQVETEDSALPSGKEDCAKTPEPEKAEESTQNGAETCEKPAKTD